MAFHRSVITDISFELVTVDTLRRLFESAGGEVMKMTVCRCDEGYVLRAHVGFQAKKAFGVMAEKSKEQRVFRSMDSALRVCKKLGFSVVQVEL